MTVDTLVDTVVELLAQRAMRYPDGKGEPATPASIDTNGEFVKKADE